MVDPKATTRRPPLFGLTRLSLGLLVVWMILSATFVQAQDIDLSTLIQETQQQSDDPNSLTVAWWIPAEFWAATLAHEPSLTDEGRKDFLKVLEPYVLVGALAGRIGPAGGATFKPIEDVRESVAIVDAEGRRHAPLSQKQISADARNVVAMMKPVLTNMLGPFGENFHFFFFRAETPEGAALAKATRPGEFTILVEGERFTWTTPLGSVIPRKICPVDRAELNGAWIYCPWHGRKLLSASP